MNNSELLTHMKNEKIQIFLRIIIILTITISLFFIDNLNILSIIMFSGIQILDFFLIIIFLNIFYYLLITNRPDFYYKERILFIAILDVFASVYIMYLVGDYSAYYPALLLWYSIGYSMRYGNFVGYSVYFSVLLSWGLLMFYSNFWIDNLSISIGWLMAFMVIPLYQFKLVKNLQDTLSLLHQDLDSSVFQAHHDDLTKLPNRLHFDKELLKASKNSEKFALFFIDLNGFKEINDTHGHNIGDQVFNKSFTKILWKFDSFSARLGGDEFVSIVNYLDLDSLEKYVEGICIYYLNRVRKYKYGSFSKCWHCTFILMIHKIFMNLKRNLIWLCILQRIVKNLIINSILNYNFLLIHTFN